MKNLILFAVVLVIAFSGCKKHDNTVIFANNYTSHLGTPRLWHGMNITYTTWMTDTSAISNYTLAISVINDTAISIMGDTLRYAGTDSTNSSYGFMYYSYHDGTTLSLTYYYLSGTINFYYYDHISAAGYSVENLSTP